VCALRVCHVKTLIRVGTARFVDESYHIKILMARVVVWICYRTERQGSTPCRVDLCSTVAILAQGAPRAPLMMSK